MRFLKLNLLSWRWRLERPPWLVRVALRDEAQPADFFAEQLCHFIVRVFPRTLARSHRHKEGAHGSHVSPEVEEALHAASRRRTAAVLGWLLLYVTWACLSWFVVAYGIEMFSLMGTKSEAAFVTTWAISVAMDQGLQLSNVGAVFSGSFLHGLLHLFWFLPHILWLEARLDAESIAHVVTTDESMLNYMMAHATHHASVGFK